MKKILSHRLRPELSGLPPGDLVERGLSRSSPAADGQVRLGQVQQGINPTSSSWKPCCPRSTASSSASGSRRNGTPRRPCSS
ncbi:MAG: hypothetical protein M0C28_45080 [Candidatus Moduliflexus flocculans]|nr:hypothetical protein [Candidatus Moduliflexus flocculans]